MIAYLALVVALAGLLLYALASNPKLVEIGRILFFCGVLVFTLAIGRQTVKLF
jgi:Na+/phosphate symporter